MRSFALYLLTLITVIIAGVIVYEKYDYYVLEPQRIVEYRKAKNIQDLLEARRLAKSMGDPYYKLYDEKIESARRGYGIYDPGAP